MTEKRYTTGFRFRTFPSPFPSDQTLSIRLLTQTDTLLIVQLISNINSSLPYGANANNGCESCGKLMSAHPGTSTHGSHNLYSFQTDPLKIGVIESFVGQHLEKQSPQSQSRGQRRRQNDLVLHFHLVRIVPATFSANQIVTQNQFKPFKLVICSIFCEL